MKYTKEEVKHAREFLVERLGIKPGDTIQTIVRHVSKSGMSRDISAYYAKGGDVFNISYHAAVLMGSPMAKSREAVKMGGCGMDMGFALVYDLAYYLFKDGFDCIGGTCPSNDHSNGDLDYTPHHHKGGGYALRQRWM